MTWSSYSTDSDFSAAGLVSRVIRGSAVRTFSNVLEPEKAPRTGAPPIAQPLLEAKRQPGRELDIVSRLSVRQFSAEALEPRHVVARLEADADAPA